jgi:hypothetical protein
VSELVSQSVSLRNVELALQLKMNNFVLALKDSIVTKLWLVGWQHWRIGCCGSKRLSLHSVIGQVEQNVFVQVNYIISSVYLIVSREELINKSHSYILFIFIKSSCYNKETLVWNEDTDPFLFVSRIVIKFILVVEVLIVSIWFLSITWLLICCQFP